MNLREQILEEQIARLEAKNEELNEIVGLLGTTTVYKSQDTHEFLEIHSRIDKSMIMASLNPKELIRKLIMHHANEFYRNACEPTSNSPTPKTPATNPKV